MCIVVPAKRGQSQDTARQLHAMRKKMVVLPILARRTGTRYRESGGGRKRGEGMGKWGDIVGVDDRQKRKKKRKDRERDERRRDAERQRQRKRKKKGRERERVRKMREKR